MRALAVLAYIAMSDTSVPDRSVYLLGPGETMKQTMELGPGEHAIIAHEMASDIELIVSAEGIDPVSIDSPRGGASHEVAILELPTQTAVSIEVKRLDQHGDGRFSVTVSSPPTDAQRSLSAAATTYSKARAERSMKGYLESARLYESAAADYGPGPLINAAWINRIRVDDPNEAIALASRALEIAEPDSIENLIARLEIGHANFSLSNVSDITWSLFSEIRATESEGFRAAVSASAWNDICLILQNRSYVVEAKECFEDAIQNFDRLGQFTESANTRYNKAIAEEALGNTAAAFDLYKAAEDYFREAGFERELARTLVETAKTLVDNGNLELAGQYFDEARAVLNRHSMTRWLARMETLYARYLQLTGRTEEANESLRRAIGLGLESGNFATAMYATTLQLERASQSAEAIRALRRTEVFLAAKDQNPMFFRWANLTMALHLAILGELDGAREMLEDLDLERLTLEQTELLKLVAAFLSVVSEPERALRDLNDAITSARQRQDSLAEMRAITASLIAGAGHMHFRTSALEWADRGSVLATSLAESFALPEHRSLVAGSLDDFFEAVVKSHLMHSETAADESYLWQIIRVLDNSRAVALRTHLAVSDSQFAASSQYERARDRTRKELWKHLTGEPTDLESALLELHTVRSSIWKSFGHSALVRSNLALEPGKTELFRYFFETEDVIYCFSITASGISNEKFDLADLPRIDRVLDGLSSPQGDGLWTAGLAEWGRVALGEAHFSTAFDTVVLIPSSSIEKLPIAALLKEEQAGLVPAGFRLKSYSIPVLSYHTSEVDRPGANPSIAILGDPVTSIKDGRVSGKLAANATRNGFGELPGSRREVRAILDAIESSGTTRTGFEANPDALLSTDVNSADMLHIAAHAAATDETGLASILLTTFDADGLPLPGALLPWDIIAARPKARFVYLSACFTDHSQPVFGDQLNSLVSAFLYVGAEAVISTQWPIDDDASAEFAKSFYRALREGNSVAGSLRAAQVELAHDPQWDHPYYWAPFTIVGRGDQHWYSRGDSTP